MKKKCFKLVKTKKLHVCLKHIPHMTYTFNIYYIVLHYKRFFFSNIYQIQLIYDVIVQHKEKFV